jgi:hypothetical protein
MLPDAHHPDEAGFYEDHHFITIMKEVSKRKTRMRIT